MKKNILFLPAVLMLTILCAACQVLPSSGSEEPVISDNQEGAYRVFVTDTGGKPVMGVRMDFCTDDVCLSAVTDEKGMCIFFHDPGKFLIHISNVPDGYTLPESDLETPDRYCDITISLS